MAASRILLLGTVVAFLLAGCYAQLLSINYGRPYYGGGPGYGGYGGYGRPYGYGGYGGYGRPYGGYGGYGNPYGGYYG